MLKKQAHSQCASGCHAHAQLEAALGSLRAAGHRITAPRRALLSVLTHEHGPFTADDLRRRLERGEGTCDQVTVYRCLATLEEANLVRRCDFGDGVYRYEFNTGDQHHHHIICRTCASVETLEGCFAEALEQLARQKGYANISHTLEIFGTCQRCQRIKASAAGSQPQDRAARG